MTGPDGMGTCRTLGLACSEMGRLFRREVALSFSMGSCHIFYFYKCYWFYFKLQLTSFWGVTFGLMFAPCIFFHSFT